MKNKKMYMGFIFVLTAMLVCSGSLPGANTVLAAEKPIKLRLLSSWGTNFLYVRDWVVPFVQRLNERSGGRLQVSWVGPEAVPPFEQLKPLSEGLFDILFTHSVYHMGQMAVGTGLDLVKGTPKERRAAGFYELLDEVYETVNAKFLGVAFGAVGYHFLLKKPLQKADLTGLKLRSSPFYNPLIKSLGGATVKVKIGEVYAALDKGIVDGAAAPISLALDFKWYEVAKFQLRPQFGELVEIILMNRNTWNNLPKDLQELVMQVQIEMEEEGYKYLTAKGKEEEQKLVNLGMNLNVLPPSEGKKLVKAFYDQTWKGVVLKHSPDFGPKMKELTDKFIAK